MEAYEAAPDALATRMEPRLINLVRRFFAMSESYHATQLPLPFLLALSNKTRSKLEPFKDEIIQYYLSGHTLRETASQFEVNPTSVRTFLKKHGVTTRAHGADLATRFHRFVEHHPSGCWIWKGYTGGKGYGRIIVKNDDGSKTTYKAHRVSYELYKGPIPEGLHIDHLCCNPSCVNPDHLEPVTAAENNRRAAARARERGTLPWRKLYINLYRETHNARATEEECVEYAKTRFGMS